MEEEKVLLASPKRYYIWTIGCQMNVADSQRLASELENLGYQPTDQAEAADVIVLNTCVVRQRVEDKVYGRLESLSHLKECKPEAVIGLMGCLVGVKNPSPLQRRFPFVDVFMPPSEPKLLLEFLKAREFDLTAQQLERQELKRRYQLQDNEFILPLNEVGKLVSAYVPIIYGCNHVCTFCIIPYRRGRERSRSVGEIVAEVRSLVIQGVKEVTLLGQIVDRYGHDVPDGSDLADLLRAIHDIEEVTRIRFLTSHPSYMTDKLLDTVAELPKVCEHIEVPIQAGDDNVLRRMKRGYTVDDYRALVARIREKIPGVSIATDIIVGFPGETEEQFMNTYDLLKELKFDVVHVAKFSPRPNTVAARWPDDVSPEEKARRRKLLDDLQAEIAGQTNAQLLGQTVEALVEAQHKGKWKGRTRTNKLVFFEDKRDHLGKLVNVRITWTGPWSMQGEVAQ
jgi:tRNA-2-methylthio-N6-dimethylallyladenosine synthase